MEGGIIEREGERETVREGGISNLKLAMNSVATPSGKSKDAQYARLSEQLKRLNANVDALGARMETVNELNNKATDLAVIFGSM